MVDHAIVVFGNKGNTTALIEWLIAHDCNPSLLVTLGAAPRAKLDIAGGDTTLADYCRSQGMAVYEAQSYKLSTDADRAFFEGCSFDLGICTGWQRLIPEHVLDRFASGVFGFHGSSMEFPNGRGRSPLNWSLRLGGRTVHHNCFRYSAGADEGALFNTTAIDVAADEPIRELSYKALVDIKLTTLALINRWRDGTLALRAQPAGASVWLPALTPADSRLDFASMGSDAIVGIVAASSQPFAGAYATNDGAIVTRIWAAKKWTGPVKAEWADAPPGALVDAANGMFLVATVDGILFVTSYDGEPAARFD